MVSFSCHSHVVFVFRIIICPLSMGFVPQFIACGLSKSVKAVESAYAIRYMSGILHRGGHGAFTALSNRLPFFTNDLDDVHWVEPHADQLEVNLSTDKRCQSLVVRVRPAHEKLPPNGTSNGSRSMGTNTLFAIPFSTANRRTVVRV
jgi:hypothetical protein